MRLNDDARRAFSVQDYRAQPAIQGVEIVDLKRFGDDGGSFIGLGRLEKGGVHAAVPGFECKQINYSETDPGVIKACHVHRRQTDVWFVPPGDKMLLVIVDVRAGSPTEKVVSRLVLGEGAARLVRIPPGVAHGVKNLAAAPGRLIYFVDTHFDPAPQAFRAGPVARGHR